MQEESTIAVFGGGALEDMRSVEHAPPILLTVFAMYATVGFVIKLLYLGAFSRWEREYAQTPRTSGFVLMGALLAGAACSLMQEAIPKQRLPSALKPPLDMLWMLWATCFGIAIYGMPSHAISVAGACVSCIGYSVVVNAMGRTVQAYAPAAHLGESLVIANGCRIFGMALGAGIAIVAVSASGLADVSVYVAAALLAVGSSALCWLVLLRLNQLHRLAQSSASEAGRAEAPAARGARRDARRGSLLADIKRTGQALQNFRSRASSIFSLEKKASLEVVEEAGSGAKGRV